MARIYHDKRKVDVYPLDKSHYKEMLRLCLVYRDKANPDSHDYFRWYRNYILILMGVNTGARIETMLQLTPRHINGGKAKITEFKTDKTQCFEMNKELYSIVNSYITEMKITNNEYIFHTFRHTDKPLTRNQAYNILQELKQKIGIKYSIGCHSLRKSYGRYIYDKHHDIYMVQRLLGHSSSKITEQYICISDEKIDRIRKEEIFI